MGQEKIKILLIDDDNLTRDGIKLNLSQSGLFEVVGEASNGKSGLQLIETLKPDLIMFDITMPIMDGHAVAKEILIRYPGLKRVVLTSSRTMEDLNTFLYLKVKGFLHKSCLEPELRESLLAVMNGELKISPVLYEEIGTNSAIANIRQKIEEQAKKLTATERRILEAFISEGGSNADLAQIVGISVKAVSFHLSNVYDKLGVKQRSDLIRYTDQWMLALNAFPDEL